MYTGTGEKQPFVPSLIATMKVTRNQRFTASPAYIDNIYINFIHHVRGKGTQTPCVCTCVHNDSELTVKEYLDSFVHAER